MPSTRWSSLETSGRAPGAALRIAVAGEPTRQTMSLSRVSLAPARLNQVKLLFFSRPLVASQYYFAE
jgi:hypothetical protein